MNTRMQCQGCEYFEQLGASDYRCCHHLLVTGRRREAAESGLCLSRKPEKRKGKNVERDKGL